MEGRRMTPVLLPGREQLPAPDVCDLPLGPQQVCDQLGEAVTDAAGSVLDDLADNLFDSFGRLLKWSMTWWTDLPAPQLTGAGGEPGPALAAIREYSGGLQVLLLTTGLIFAAGRLAMAKRAALAGEAQESVLMLARAVFTSMGFAAVVTVGTRAGDAFSDWVLTDVTRGDWARAIEHAIDLNTVSGPAQLGTGVLLVIGLLGTISALAQLVMLVVRQALLIVVVAVIPLAAAAAGTGPGSQAYKRLLGWALAFVLYKPVGALVYAIALTVIGGQDQQDPQQVLLGLILLVMSVVVLPALIRLVAPAVSVLGGGGGAGAALAGGAAGIAMAGVGDRSQARTASENDTGHGGTGAPSGSPTPPGGAGGGGRAMPGGGSDASAAADSGDGSHGRSGGGSISPGSGGGARSAGVAPKPGAGAGSVGGAPAGGGEAAAAAGAGPAGAAVMAGQVAKDAAKSGVSAMESETRNATEGGLDPDALGPGEVRR
ncbi:hypothetical protein [Nocardia sp. NPDC057227]|uniref:hypothetical protein n=1 Tax=Nocardia sp. NPDC057227 TaxID=3346056 RepID=UPI003638D378